MYHPGNHTGLGQGHLVGESADDAEVHDQLHFVAVDQQLCCRGRCDLADAAVDDIEDILLVLIVEHVKATAMLGLSGRSVAGEDTVHLHRDQQSDSLFPLHRHITLTRTTSSISRMLLTVSS